MAWPTAVRALIPAVLSLVGILPLIVAGDEAVTDVGPALWGNPNYWVKLSMLTFSEGTLSPAFDADGTEFTLTVKNPEVRSVSVTIMLQISKYNLMQTPQIEVDYQIFDYTPLNPITVQIPLNENEGALDKWVSFKISDKQGGKGGFFGHAAKSKEYKVRVLQPPEFNKVVRTKQVLVKTVDGIELTPQEATGNLTGTYTYTIPKEQFTATVQAWCDDYSTKMSINGEPASPGASLQVEMDSPSVTTLVDCMYEDAMWTTNIVQRTYQIRFVREGVAGVVKLRMMPDVGHCEYEDKKWTTEQPRYVCRSARDHAILVADYDSGSESLFLDNLDGGEGINLIRGLPTRIETKVAQGHYQLRLRAGAVVKKIPVVIYRAQHCSTFQCPAGWVPAAKMDAGMDAELHTCHSHECDLAADGDTCCRRAGEPCQAWAHQYKCSKGEFFSLGMCKGMPCEESDSEYCCLDNAKVGEFGPAVGTEERTRWETAHEAAVDAQKKHYFKETMTFTMSELKNANAFAGELQAKLAVEAAIAKLIGCESQFVSAELSGAMPVTATITVQSEEGLTKNKQLADAMTALTNEQVQAELRAEVKALGITEEALIVGDISDATLVQADMPVFKTYVIVEAPPDLKIEEPDAQDSKSMTVNGIMKASLAKQLKIAEDQVKLTFVPAKPGEGPIEPGLVGSHVELEIALNPGDDGGLKVLMAKLCKVDAREINWELHRQLPEKGLPENKAKVVKVVYIQAENCGSHTPEYILGVWLKEDRTTTKPPAVQMVQVVTNAEKCLAVKSRNTLGSPVIASPCDTTSEDQQWTFTVPRGQILNTFGSRCLAADLNGPPGEPSWHLDTNPNVLQDWIRARGPAAVHQWDCNDHWQQQWEYVQETGLIKLSLSSNPGLCLQIAHPEATDANLQVALCDKNKFSQQFWFNEAPLSDYLPSGSVSAQDLPSFVKPFFEGEVASKLPDGQYSFALAPFAKKRAAFYLTQGCGPIPSKSCGTPMPEMPGVYVGEPLIKMDEDVDHVPWHVAIAGSDIQFPDVSKTTCVYDPKCAKEGANGGCNAGGKPTCRYCGFGAYQNCSQHFVCDDGGLHKGLWSEEKELWCCEHFSVGCKPPHDCLKDIQTWKTSWTPEKQSWCCQYEDVGCPYECKTDFSVWDPSVWDQNHAFWCSIFGTGRAHTENQQQQSSSPSEFESLIMKKTETQPREHFEGLKDSTWQVIPWVAAGLACALLVTGIFGVWRGRSRSGYAGAAERSLVMAAESQAFMDESGTSA